MNVWKLTAVNNIEKFEEEAVPVAGKRKIRVTKVLMTAADAAVYRGKRKVAYPRILGRFAVGVIADDENERLPKGTRVLLHANFPEQEAGTEKRDFSKYGSRVCGLNTDGYLRDFVYADENSFTVLPDSVNDEKALLIQHIAIAKAAIETLAPKRGDHIAVIGAGLTGLFACQLLIYQQVAPLLVDSREDRLEFAKSCGVYYTTKDGEEFMENIASITGGRFSDGVLFTTGAGANAKCPFTVCARDTSVVFCGMDEDDIKLDLVDILNRQLSVHGISDGVDYIETAINLVANKAMDLSAFHMNLITPDKLKALFQDYDSNPERAVNEMNVVNLL